MRRLLPHLPPLVAAAYVGVGVATGVRSAGLAPGPWVGAALCLVAAGTATAAGRLLTGPRRAVVVIAGALAAAVCLPPPFQPLGLGTALGPFAAAAGAHALWAVLLPPGQDRRAGALWLVPAYSGAAIVASGRLSWAGAEHAWAFACLTLALILAAHRLRNASSLLQEAVALRVVLGLATAAVAGAVGLALAPATPELAGGVAAVVLAEAVRRGAIDVAREDTSFSPVEPVVTVATAALFGALPLALAAGSSSLDVAPLALAAALFGAVLAAPAVGRRALAVLDSFGRRRAPDLEDACLAAALATEEAVDLEEVARGLVPVAAALTRGGLAVVSLETDRTAVIGDGEVETVDGAGHGPALAEVLGRRRRPMLAAHLVDRSVREVSLRPAADLVARVGAELLVPLPCGDSLPGVLLVGRPPAGRLRARRAARLAELGAVLGPRLRAGVLLGQGGARIVELETRLECLEDRVEALGYRAERLAEENRLLRDDRAGTAPREVVGRSPAMRALLAEVRRVADSPASVLVRGEPGSGRLLVARSLHQGSPRRDRPLVHLDPAGAAGAQQLDALGGTWTEEGGRPGLAELADGGTLVVENIAELTAEAQASLVRVLSEGEVSRRGGSSVRQVDVRLVAIASATEDGEMLLPELRERLGQVRLDVPPLRERRGDVPHLARFFLARVARKHGLGAAGFAPEAFGALEMHDWPGNVRQLRAVVEQAALTARGPAILLEDLPPLGTTAPPPAAPARTDERDEQIGDVLEGTLHEVEAKALARALEKARGNKSEAARLLGLKRTTFMDRLRKHDLA